MEKRWVATIDLETLEVYSRTVALARLMGRPHAIPESKLEELDRLFRRARR